MELNHLDPVRPAPDRPAASRRSRASLSLTAVLGAGALALTACSSGDAQAGSGDFGEIDVPLSWIKTAEFGGLYMAQDEGYYEEAGFDVVNLVPGGPSATPAATQVATGSGLVGMSNPVDIGSLLDAEGDAVSLRIIGSVFQQNSFSVFSIGDDAAESPEDLVGMRIGVAPNNEAVFRAFLQANDIAADDVEMVSVQGDASPLIDGEVDAYVGYSTNQALSVELEGHDVTNLMFAENGLPFAAGSIITTEEAVEGSREELKAFLEASIRGWHDALADDEAVATTTVETHAADQGLDYEHQLLTAERQSELITSESTEADGLLTTSEDLQQDTLESVELVGYDMPDDIFDLSLLEEVYEENPDLVDPS